MPSTRSAKSGRRATKRTSSSTRGKSTSGTKRATKRATKHGAKRARAKKGTKYGEAASRSVESAMRRRKRGTLESGSGDRVTSRKQAIAIGLSEARSRGGKVPRKKKSSS